MEYAQESIRSAVRVLNRDVISVAAYCRVSTDSLDQANSLQNQQMYFDDYISRHDGWELYDIYADEGISGTTTKNRNAFNQMLEDAEKGCFDLILTKEISRFARNTLDSIKYTRRLREIGVGVIFINDGINTLDSDAELRLTILASIAQEESRKTSQRVKWGQRRSMERGVVFGLQPFGYNLENGVLTVNENEAQIVRRIFYEFLQNGKGAHRIAAEFQAEGVALSPRMKSWSHTAVLRILKNEKYCGDLIQQKTYTPDYLTHAKKRNDGKIDKVTIVSHHQPIISKEIFDSVQKELQRRCGSSSSKDGCANRYALSGKIKCAACNSAFIRRRKLRQKGREEIRWVCKGGTDGTGKCSCAGSIADSDIKAVLCSMISEITADNQYIYDEIKSALETVLSRCGGAQKLREKTAKTNEAKERLMKLYLSGEVTEEEYIEAKSRIDKRRSRLIYEMYSEAKSVQSETENKERLCIAESYARRILSGEEWSEAFFRSLLESVTIYPNRRLEVKFRLMSQSFSARILSGKREIEAYEKEKDIGGCSAPMSVSNPFNSGYGIE